MEKYPQGEKTRRTFRFSFSFLLIIVSATFVLINPKYVTCDNSGVSGIGHDEEREIGYKEACDDASATKRTVDIILPHLLNIYGSKATAEDFEIYAPDATFEDPLMSAHGIKEIKSAFYSLPKVFSESRIVDYSVREDMISPSKQEILIDNKQHYKIMGKDINMISLIKLQVEDGKVVRHEDCWDKKPLLNRNTVNIPFLGRTLETARRGSMMATHVMMRFGKDPAV